MFPNVSWNCLGKLGYDFIEERVTMNYVFYEIGEVPYFFYLIEYENSFFFFLIYFTI